MASGDEAGRRTSDWPCGPELERAAGYVSRLRAAAGHGERLRAAASREGLSSLRTVLRDLPELPLAFSDAPAGREMRAWFRPDRRLPFNRVPVAVLPLPASTAEYLRGRPRQALRTNLSRAAAEGLSCAPVDTVRELRRVAGAIAARRGTDGDSMVHPDLVPGPARRFSAAYDAAGDPVALSHAVVDGERAGLVLMVTAVDHAQASLVRYALHTSVVGRLVDSGATTLVVGGSMLLTSEGTRYFQRRTGFTPVRVVPLPPRHEAAAPRRPVVAPVELGRAAERSPAELTPGGRR